MKKLMRQHLREINSAKREYEKLMHDQGIAGRAYEKEHGLPKHLEEMPDEECEKFYATIQPLIEKTGVAYSNMKIAENNLLGIVDLQLPKDCRGAWKSDATRRVKMLDLAIKMAQAA